jgi:hypothetical protein
MTEMGEKKGRMKVTIELEVNEELLSVVKEGMAQMSQHMPEMMRRGNKSQQ